MLAIRQILVATDFSDCSQQALDYACELASRFQASLHLVHVIKENVPYHGYDIRCPDDVRECLDALPGMPWAEQLTVTRRVRVGPPALEIVTEASEQSSDMIVMGTQGRGALTSLLLGSVAEKVVRTAPCPVLTLRHDVPAEEATTG